MYDQDDAQPGRLRAMAFLLRQWCDRVGQGAIVLLVLSFAGTSGGFVFIVLAFQFFLELLATFVGKG